MICSSLNRLPFIRPSPLRDGLYLKPVGLAGCRPPQLRTVGLAEGAVREAQERVKAAIKNSGYEFPNRKITINLAPADTRKEGSSFDLPIALAILAANT